MSIRLDGVCKAYGPLRVLQNINAELPSPGAACVMGPSGAGKTTLLRLLLRLEEPDTGRIDGLAGLRMSAVFQDNRLLPFCDAVGNLTLVLGERGRARAEAALAALLLPREAFHKPIAELSGGMRRRVALARALAVPFDLLVLDEPFKELDDATRAHAMAVVREAALGRTLVFASHNASEAAFFDARVLNIPRTEQTLPD